MKESEALRIVKFFNMAFPRDALEPDSATLYGQEIALLYDGQIGETAARECARNLDHFPSIHEFRESYKSVSKRVEAERAAAQRALEPPPDPETREEIAAMMADMLHRMEQPDGSKVEIEDLGRGDCSDCHAKNVNTWTFGESRRPLCGRCCSMRLRAQAVV